MSIQLRLSPEQVADLERVASFGASVLDEVKERLGSVESPTLDPNGLLNAIRQVVDDERAEPLARQLLSLRGIVRQSGESIPAVIKALGQGVASSSLKSSIDVGEWDSVLASLEGLVGDNSVRLAATAIALSYDYANLLRWTRVLTDVRPIFNEAGDGIQGAVVSFTMRLRYSNAGGEHDMSIALDEKDIETLRRQCERAMMKAKTARSVMVDRCRVPAVVSGGGGDA
jgi:hypothetical protein